MLDKTTHTYTSNKTGRRQDSVTHIIKMEGLMGSFYRRGSGIMVPTPQMERGTVGHELTDYHDKGYKILEYPDMVAREFDQYLKFKKDAKFRVQFSEQEIENPMLGYMGTADKFGWLGDTPVCLDLKFSSGSGCKWHEYQSIAYTMGCVYDEKLKAYVHAKRYALILQADRYLLIPHDKVKDIERKWMAVCIAYHAKKEMGIYDIEKDYEEETW